MTRLSGGAAKKKANQQQARCGTIAARGPDRLVARASFSLASCFALVLSGCCTHSTCGCKSGPYETTSDVEVTADQLRMLLDENGRFSPGIAGKCASR